MSDEIERRHWPDAERVYRNGQIAVYWEPGLCIHAAYCIRGLPDVFDPDARPWVSIDAAPADEIADVVMRCPSGALHFERLDGGAQEEAETPTTIVAVPDGPLYVRGQLKVRSEDGSVRAETRAALCRCGHSANKPFCDNTHRRIGFRSEA